jgi:hypothetical protein
VGAGFGSGLFLHPSNGGIYRMDDTVYTQTDGNPMYRERTFPLTAEVEVNRIRVNKLEVSAETGATIIGETNPQVWVDTSFDGGNSFGQSRYQSLGGIGARGVTLNWWKLGTGRRPVVRLATTAQTKISFLGADADMKPLSR